MTFEKEDKKALSVLRMEKARKYLSDAEANYKDGRYETSVNRSYYAALSAVRSLLILEGVDTESHKGAITMLSLRFVKTAVLSRDIVKKFELLLSRRTDVDYGDLDAADAPDAEDSLKIAGELVEEINAVRGKLIENL